MNQLEEAKHAAEMRKLDNSAAIASALDAGRYGDVERLTDENVRLEARILDLIEQNYR